MDYRVRPARLGRWRWRALPALLDPTDHGLFFGRSTIDRADSRQGDKAGEQINDVLHEVTMGSFRIAKLLAASEIWSSVSPLFYQ